MARFDHVVRVARALQKLQETRAGITVRALAQDLEVGERTAYRYIEALIREGYPLENEGGRLRLPRTAPGRLTAEEERQLRMLAMASYPLEGSPLLPRVEAIISRLGEHTPRQSDLFARLKVPLTTRGLLAIDYTAHESVLRTLLKAMEEQKTVRARYFTASRQEETERDLDPYHFHYDAGLETLYLIGYCHWRREVRIFAGHRFRAVMSDASPVQARDDLRRPHIPVGSLPHLPRQAGDRGPAEVHARSRASDHRAHLAQVAEAAADAWRWGGACAHARQPRGGAAVRALACGVGRGRRTAGAGDARGCCASSGGAPV